MYEKFRANGISNPYPLLYEREEGKHALKCQKGRLKFDTSEALHKSKAFMTTVEI